MAESLRKTKYGKAAYNLRQIKPQIMDRWEVTVRETVAVAGEKDSLVLQDKLGRLLDNLIEALTPGSSKYDATSDNDVSKTHGQHRAVTEGYSLAQVLQEYSLLRKTILWSLAEQDPLEDIESEIINDSIDKAMKDSAQEFSEVQKSQVKIALQRAEASNQDLERFAAIAAHDLKSPLSSITGLLNLIYEQYQDVASAETKEMFDFILDASSRMREMVDRLLSYASLRSISPEFMEVDLNDVVNKASADLKTYIEDKKAAISHPPLPKIQGDLILLIQLFQNLITNGIKYNISLEPEIKVTSEDLGESWRINVQDNGIGIKAEDKKFLFQAFKRLHSEKEYQGAGLGLATCYRIMELHHGKINLLSTPQKGSIFQLEFPKKNQK